MVGVWVCACVRVSVGGCVKSPCPVPHVHPGSGHFPLCLLELHVYQCSGVMDTQDLGQWGSLTDIEKSCYVEVHFTQ